MILRLLCRLILWVCIGASLGSLVCAGATLWLAVRIAGACSQPVTLADVYPLWSMAQLVTSQFVDQLIASGAGLGLIGGVIVWCLDYLPDR